ncbi:MAG: hypothetical protein CV089_00190 [Nitrospira sp. WS110]|nr:hypothetical protein [Nitrospira sp. WS110]
MSPQDITRDMKDMKIAGCDVHLVFVRSEGDWTVVGTLTSGTADNKRKETITSGPWATRDLAEQKALEQITTRLGHNEDRSTSRVNNPGEETGDQGTERKPTG